MINNSVVLFVFPHPDDETMFAGGTIARHVSRGDEVVWLCASLGERGGIAEKRSARLFCFAYLLFGYFPFLIFFQRAAVWWLSVFRKSSRETAETRRGEAEEAARIYGISKPHFLGIEDMRFGKNPEDIEREAEKCLERHKPRIVYTFHPNGITNHPDHRNLSESVAKIVRNLPGEDKPELLGATIPRKIVKKYRLPLLGTRGVSRETRLNERELEKKKRAISAYKSQKYLWEFFLKKYPELLEKEYFVELK